MCGLTGFSGKYPANPEKLALLMYHNSVKRGEDNTGFFTFEEGLKKGNKKAEEFLAENIIPKTKTFIGHVRRGSVGGKLAECSHPFEFSNIVLVHNGTLSNHWQLAYKSNYKYDDFKVDSEILAKLLDDNSLQEEEKRYKVLSDFKGAAAILFVDKREPNAIYAYTNGDRPLVCGMIGTSMYISSTEESLKLIHCKNIKSFNENYLYKIENGKVVSADYYKPAEIVKTSNYHNTAYHNNCYDNSTSKIVNLRIKDHEEIEKLVKNIPDSVDYIDRWVRCTIECTNKKYGDENNNFPKTTRDNWYFITDNVLSNNYDLQFVDDNNNHVIAGKYSFNHLDLKYNGFGVAVSDIISNGTNKIVFKKGDIVEIPEDEPNGDKIGVYHAEHNKTYNCPTSTIRPLTEKELESISDREVEKINENLNEDKIPNPDNENKLPVIINNYDDNEDEDEPPFDADDNDNCELIINQKEEDEKVSMYIVETLEEQFADIKELVEATDFKELKDAVMIYEQFLEAAYDYGTVKENMEENFK